MRREEDRGIRKIRPQLFPALFYTLLFLIMAGLLGCHGGSSSNPPAAKVFASIEVRPANNHWDVGTTGQFTLNNIYTDGSSTPIPGSSPSWSSSSPAVATISPDGMVIAVSAGKTTITATLGNVPYATELVVVPRTLVSIAITPSNPTIAINTSHQFTATGAYSDNTTQDLTTQVTWSSSDTSKATIAPDGKATALASGSTTITARSGIVSGTTTLNVTQASFQSIAVTSSNSAIVAGTTLQFSAKGTFTDNTTQDLTTQVTWSSSDRSKATIDSGGKVTAIAPGSTTITATLGDASSNTSLTITSASLLSIAVTPSNPVIAAGTTQQFSATGTFSDNTTQDLTNQVTWSSSAGSIAGIDRNGKSTAVAAGTTVISAMLGGVSGSQDLSVTKADATGTWEGTYTIYDSVDPLQIGTYTFKLVLNQSGTSVTGTSSLRYNTSGQLSADGRLTEGKVTGSQFDFIFTYNDPRHSWEMVNVGTATVTDTTMTGNVLENYNGGYNCSYIFSLKKR